jgi:molecular chaperone GrpE (heat shock protein)
MLNLTDIVALAKQGYKPNDIKELIELTKEAPEGNPEDQEKQPKPEEPEKPSEDKPLEDNKKDGAASSDQLNYKEEVEKLKAQLQETENKLSKLQKENVRRRADPDKPEKSDAEAFADVMKSFM